MKRSLLAVAALLTLAPILHGQEPAFERILLPVYNGEIAGAFGSRWTTELAIANTGAGQPRVVPATCLATCGEFFFPSHYGTIWKRESDAGMPNGALLYIERPYGDDIKFELRAHDLSRQALTWGTEIPVVRERNAIAGTILLLNVPLDERFRQTLRVYDFDSHPTADVGVRFFSADRDVPYAADDALADVTLHLTGTGGAQPTTPGYAILSNFADALPQLKRENRVNVEITPLAPGLRLWAFITITHNETQHVTTITPQ